MLPPTEREGALPRFRVADWIVPPVVFPLFLLLFHISGGIFERAIMPDWRD